MGFHGYDEGEDEVLATVLSHNKKGKGKVQASTSHAHDFDDMDYISMPSFSFWCLTPKRESKFEVFVNIIYIYIYVWDM